MGNQEVGVITSVATRAIPQGGDPDPDRPHVRGAGTETGLSPQLSARDPRPVHLVGIGGAIRSVELQRKAETLRRAL